MRKTSKVKIETNIALANVIRMFTVEELCAALKESAERSLLKGKTPVFLSDFECNSYGLRHLVVDFLIMTGMLGSFSILLKLISDLPCF